MSKINKNSLLMFFIGLVIGALFVAGLFLGVFQDRYLEKPEVIQKIITQNCPKNPADEILPPPKIDAGVPEVLVTTLQGEAKIEWEPVKHAVGYQIKLYDDKGKVVRTWRSVKPHVALRNIPFLEDKEFTRFTYTIATVNRNDKVGDEAPPRKLESRRLKGLMAPTVKGIQVED
jgi:hypothetical protein